MATSVILGAGFSYAVSKHMPLTERLGALMLEGLKRTGTNVPRPPGAEGFERWLSRYAEPQPDLTEAENLENRALFTRLAAELRKALVFEQSKAFEEAPAWWLRRLIGALHYGGGATISTFNYDTIVESALEWCWLLDEENHRATYNSALRFAPPLPYQPPGGLTYGEPRARTFSLLKLHGSIDSFWVPGDASGATINRWNSEMRFQRPVVASDDSRRQALPGREPFIIPPAAGKSSFYNNPVTREIWQQAAHSIRTADEVAIIGYSLPSTDLITGAMLSDNLRNAASRVVVVNPDAETVVDGLVKLGIPERRITVIDDPVRGCEMYAERLEQRFRPSLTSQSGHVDLPVAVGTLWSVQHRVRGIRAVDGEVLTLDVDSEPWEGGVLYTSGPTIQDLRDAAGSDHPKIRVEWTDGNCSWVAQTVDLASPSGAPEVLLLRVTAQPVTLAH